MSDGNGKPVEKALEHWYDAELPEFESDYQFDGVRRVHIYVVEPTKIDLVHDEQGDLHIRVASR